MSDLSRLFAEDCIEGAQKHIPDNSVDLIITDPPYGINATQLHRHYHRIESNVLDGYVEIPLEEYPEFSRKWIDEAERILRPGGSLYIVSGYSNLIYILDALKGTTLNEINHIIWKYNFGVYTTKKYVSSHYHILYYTKPGGVVTFNTFSRYGADEKDQDLRSKNYRDREDVWEIPREYKPGQIKNKNELPVQLLIKIIQYSSNPGDLIADFFMGGFSTAKVAIGLNRQITGFEINHAAFRHHLKELQILIPGYLSSGIRIGHHTLPANKHKRWTEQEQEQLKKRYEEIYNRLKHKRRTIKILESEFGRGYFSILNQLEQLLNK